MARMARVVVPGFPHHVTQRGNRRQKTFFSSDDYRLYKQLIGESSRQTGTEIWAYCLMPNHVHLVMVPSMEDGLRETLGEAHRRYTRHVNAREGWRGHLWQERFHSFPMDERYLMAAVRYVEMNPVAAGLCRHPAEWDWSSATAHIERKDDLLVRVNPMLQRVGDWLQYLSVFDSSEVANSFRSHARTGRPLGNGDFVRHLETVTGKELVPLRRGRKPAALK